MDQSANRDIADRHRIAWLDIHCVTRHHGVADSKTLRGDDVGQLAIGIFDQGNEGRPVRIIFDPFNGSDFVVMTTTLEVDDPIGLLVSAATETNRDATIVVTTAGGGFPLGQHLHGLALEEFAAVNNHQLPKAWGDWFKGFECHGALSSALTDQS